MSKEDIREAVIIAVLLCIAVALMMVVDPGLSESPYNSF